jgi:TorA maturation chaperone TorD
MLASGKPPVELIQSVLSSAVFAARLRTNQMSNEEYVHRMYGLLLGREADGQGYTDYVSHLNNGDLSRPEVAEALVASGEFAQRHREIFWGREFEPPPRECDLSLASRMEQDFERRVAYAHCLVLGSLPEPELLEQWSMALKERQASTIDLVVALLGSEAFAARYVPEDLPDPAFVTFIYRLLLEREPDGQGFQDYTAQLNAGELSKAAIARALVTSGEFEARHAVLAE